MSKIIFFSLLPISQDLNYRIELIHSFRENSLVL